MNADALIQHTDCSRFAILAWRSMNKVYARVSKQKRKTQHSILLFNLLAAAIFIVTSFLTSI